MGTLFGIGAPPYAIYLSRRIDDKSRMRATLSTMVLFSTGMRLVAFAFAGLVLPGVWLGHRVHLSMSREKVLAAISVLLIAGGISLLGRVLFAA
ncbi:MAG: hypothetical protein ACXWCY_01100 [Burkholderiales bacterium]